MKKIGKSPELLSRIIIMLFSFLNVAYVISRMKFYTGDFDLRWMEAAYFIRGYDPFLSISGGLTIDEIGLIPEYAGSMPWAYPMGCLLVFPFLPRATARICGAVLFLAVGAAAAVMVWRRLENKNVTTAFALLASWSTASTFMSGNYGGMCSLLIILSVCIYKKHPIGAGLLLALSLVKPQIGGLFVITYLLMGQWAVVAMAGAACILCWGIASLAVRMSPIDMLAEIWTQSGSYQNVEINTGLFTFMRNFGLGNGVILICGAVVGIGIMTFCYFRLKPLIKEKEEIVFLPFLPAAMLQPLWFFSHPFDLMTLALPLLILLGYKRERLFRSGIKEALLLSAVTVQCMYGYLIWEKGAAKVLRIVGLSQFWSRDLSLLASNILYIVILMVLMSILPRVFAKTKQEKKEDI